MQTPPFHFPLTSEDCELLVALEHGHTLAGTADLLHRDISAISRRLNTIAGKANVLEKDRGRWNLSPLGKDLVRWARDAQAAQTRLLREQTQVRIAATREFGARILSRELNKVFPDGSRYSFSILTSEEGVESALLSGQADLGFDCGHPQDPLVAFQRAVKESFTIVASSRFIEKYHASATNLLSLPHLQYRRASTPRLLKLSYDLPRITASFNDIAAIREAALSHLGWAVLPTYTIQRELEAKELTPIPGW